MFVGLPIMCTISLLYSSVVEHPKYKSEGHDLTPFGSTQFFLLIQVCLCH